MKLLALDTSTEACSAALSIDGETIQRFHIAPREHAILILSMLDVLLAEAGITVSQLDALAFGRGPGSFTGIRIGTGVVQGIAYAAELPVVPVSTLAALAQGAWADTGSEAVLTAIDARMQEVYWGAFRLGEAGVMQAVAEECVSAPEAIPLPDDGEWLAVGTGWASYGDAMLQAVSERGFNLTAVEGERLPRSQDIAVLAVHAFGRGEAVAPEQALPVYLRNEVAWKKA